MRTIDVARIGSSRDVWIMPILTMPFDEGVTGAVGGHKVAAGEAKQEYRRKRRG